MSQTTWGSQATKYFYDLNPDIILEAFGQIGLKSSGRLMQLNSMENRVYEIESNDDQDLSFIAKFYRPSRWSREQIQEEHEFMLELKEAGVPVAAPIMRDGISLFYHEKSEIFFSVTPKYRGRTPYDLQKDDCLAFGRSIALIHKIGAKKKFLHRPTLSFESYGQANLNFLLQSSYLPEKFRTYYAELVGNICTESAKLISGHKFIRTHGDCHRGNLFLNSEGPLFLDFDDSVMAPAIQDIWLLTPGRDEQTQLIQDLILFGYQEVLEFNYDELQLVEVLRALRYIHFSAWIAKRWEDQSFQITFPHFGSDEYWSEQIRDLNDQLELIRYLNNRNPNFT